MTTVSKETAEWFEKQFIEWRNQRSRRDATLTAFAKFIGVSRGTLNNWMIKKQTPEKESANILATKLGPGIYDVLGLPRPDPLLQFILQNWGQISEEVRQQVHTLAAKDIARLTRASVAEPKPKREK